MTSEKNPKPENNTSIKFTTSSTAGDSKNSLIFDSSISNVANSKKSSQIVFNDSSLLNSQKISIDTTSNINKKYPSSNSEVFLEEKLSKYYEALKSNFDKESKSSQDKLFEHLKTAQGSLDTSVNKVLEELKEVRNSVLGTIALFAAFFTFASVNVNIFTKAEGVVHAVLFMFSMWLCIIGLISLFFYYLNFKKFEKRFEFIKPELITTLICIILSCVVVYFLSTPLNDKKNKMMQEKIDDLTSQNNKIKANNVLLNKQLEELKNDVYILKRDQYNINHPK